MATEQEGHTPWGVEQTENMLWIGPMRPDGCKVDQVVVSLNYDRDLTVSAKLRQLQRAYLIASAPDLLAAAQYQEHIQSSAFSGDPSEAIAKVRIMRRAAIARATGEA